jgi:hypothetical protein
MTIVATWNLTHRDVRSNDDDGVLTIEGSPVKFFHFSGFDSGAQKVMLKKYASKDSPLFKLRKWYVQELDKEGQKKLGRLPCVYSFYSNGELITIAHRAVYRSRQDLIQAFSCPDLVTEDEACYFYWFKKTFLKESSGKEYTMPADDQLLVAMLNSRSWRMTRPLRRLGQFLRKCRGVVRRML